MITLTAGGTTVTLNPDLYWSDEFNWQTVERSVSRSITGARIVQVGAKVGGRPITLQPEDDGSGWTRRDALEQLQAWANTPALALTLSLRGVTRAVEFESLEARPVIHFNDTEPGDYYLVTLRLTEA